MFSLDGLCSSTYKQFKINLEIKAIPRKKRRSKNDK